MQVFLLGLRLTAEANPLTVRVTGGGHGRCPLCHRTTESQCLEGPEWNLHLEA